MGSNTLKLNAKKSQLIWIGTGKQLAKLTVTQLQLINSVVEFDSMATNLDVVLDGQLSMSAGDCCLPLVFLLAMSAEVSQQLLHLRGSPFSYTGFCSL